MLSLLLSSRCAICRRLGSHVVCEQCAAALHSLTPTQWQRDRPGVPVLRAVGRHQGVLREAVLAWKERGRADLAPVFAQLLSPLIPGDAVLVPIPSRLGSRFQRSQCVISALAHEVGTTVDALHHVRRSADQSTLTANAREKNVDQTLRLLPRSAAVLSEAVALSQPIVLLDDIYTTGSTIREGVRSLSACNIPVSMAVVLAAAGNDRWQKLGYRSSV